MTDIPVTDERATVLHAVALLRQGYWRVDISLRPQLAELLEDLSAGDDEGVVHPCAVDLANAILGRNEARPSPRK